MVASGAMALAPLFLLAACPSLGEIGVGSPADAAVDRASEHSRTDGGTDRRAEAADAAPQDAGVDARCVADTGSDPSNCGRCGHDCLGGNCSAGACQPVVLYTGGTPVGIVVDGPTLIVTIQGSLPESGYVFRCAASDCGSTKTVLASGFADPWFPAKEGASVYWVDFGGDDAATTPGSVLGCPENGCPDAGPLLYPLEGGGPEGGTNYTGLAVDSTYVYWASITNLIGSVYRCAPTECASTLAQLGSGFGIPYAVAVDASYIFWIDLDTSQVFRCALPSCGDNPEIFANVDLSSSSVPLSGLALYDGNVYWTQGVADGSVFRCPTSGCGGAPTTVATHQGDPSFVAVDDSGVYWVNSGDNSIAHCPLEGCARPTVIARTLAPFAIALDPQNIYFTSATVAGKVLRVAK